MRFKEETDWLVEKQSQAAFPTQRGRFPYSPSVGKLAWTSRTASAPQMLHRHDVPTLECLAIRFTRRKWNLRMTELLMSGGVTRTIVLEVTPSRLDSIMEGAALKIIRVLRRWSIPSTGLRLVPLLRRRRSTITALFALHMFHRHEVPAFIGLAVSVAGRKRNLRMPKLIMRGRVESTMALEVLPRRFDPIVKRTALQVVRILRGRRIPSALSLLITRRRTLRRSVLSRSWRKRKDQGTSTDGSGRSYSVHAFSVQLRLLLRVRRSSCTLLRGG